MRETIRQIALDIIVIWGALCIIWGFVLIIQWIWISATWMQVTYSIKRTTQQIIDGVLHPIKLISLFLEYRLWESLSSKAEAPQKTKAKKKVVIKSKKA